VGLENELADKVGSWVTVIMGAIFVACVLAFRRGIVGELLALRGRAAAPRPLTAAPPPPEPAAPNGLLGNLP
jgi:hypothetical protein